MLRTVMWNDGDIFGVFSKTKIWKQLLAIIHTQYIVQNYNILPYHREYM